MQYRCGIYFGDKLMELSSALNIFAWVIKLPGTSATLQWSVIKFLDSMENKIQRFNAQLV